MMAWLKLQSLEPWFPRKNMQWAPLNALPKGKRDMCVCTCILEDKGQSENLITVALFSFLFLPSAAPWSFSFSWTNELFYSRAAWNELSRGNPPEKSLILSLSRENYTITKKT